MSESPVAIHIWDLDAAHEQAALQSLTGMYERVGPASGLISARLMRSEDRSSIAAIVEMESVQARQRFLELPEVRETLEHLQGAVNVVFRTYHETTEIRPH